MVGGVVCDLAGTNPAGLYGLNFVGDEPIPGSAEGEVTDFTDFTSTSVEGTTHFTSDFTSFSSDSFESGAVETATTGGGSGCGAAVPVSGGDPPLPLVVVTVAVADAVAVAVGLELTALAAAAFALAFSRFFLLAEAAFFALTTGAVAVSSAMTDKAGAEVDRNEVSAVGAGTIFWGSFVCKCGKKKLSTHKQWRTQPITQNR